MMSKEDEYSNTERWFRRHPKGMIVLWLLLVVAAALSLMFVGYAAPTLYEGF